MAKNFCRYPWEHVYIHTTGHFRTCCYMNENVTNDDGYRHFNAKRDSINDLWNSKYYRDIRKAMLEDKRLDKCNKCWFAEDNGIQSMRRPVGRDHFAKHTDDDGKIDILPTDMELHFGNVCNLSCKMCSTQFSHLIGKELLKIGDNDPDFLKWVKKESGMVNNWTSDLETVFDWYKNDKLKKEIFDVISRSVNHLTVIGGEPTVIAEFWELLDYCSTRGTLKDKHLTICTNLTNTNPKLTDWLKELRTFTIHASIDGIEDRNTYIRYPSNWKAICKSIDFYAHAVKSLDKGGINFNPAVQLLNIDQLIELVQYFEQYPRVGSSTWTSHVKYPLICDYDNAPQTWKEAVADKLLSNLHKVKQEQNIENVKNHALRLQKKFDHPNIKNIQKAFIRYNDTQDKFRKTKTWRELLPDLEKALTESIA